MVLKQNSIGMTDKSTSER